MDVNITLSIEDKLVKEVRKIAPERDTTLTQLVREHLETLAGDDDASERKRREGEALENSFAQLQLSVGERNWKREDLHEQA